MGGYSCSDDSTPCRTRSSSLFLGGGWRGRTETEKTKTKERRTARASPATLTDASLNRLVMTRGHAKGTRPLFRSHILGASKGGLIGLSAA